MTGIKNFNADAFVAGARLLRQQGREVFGPLEADARGFQPWGKTGNEPLEGFTRRDALGCDLARITAHAEAIAMLPGWERSSGARAEHTTAIALGEKMQFIYLREDDLARANELKREERPRKPPLTVV